ncbi:MAG: Hsp20 family protein [Chitinivibrionales bacterium]|nr:Hsp20 family protein [Chitinivibrionales bacterium]
MHFVTPWSLSKKKPRRQSEEASFPWRHSGRSSRSKRAGHRRAYPWDKLSGLVANALGSNGKKEAVDDAGMRQGVLIDPSSDRVKVKVGVPPVRKQDIYVGYENGILHIRGHKRTRMGKSRRISRFTHEIRLGRDLTWTNARAHLQDHTLTVEIPRSPNRERGKKQIQVE